ncbi:MAG: NUDIX domain-containing protein [Christensenellales bacterium]|jgi:8-oxo-dGTP diphosphatase
MAYIPSCEEEALFLKNFDPGKYQNPAVAADTALFAFYKDEIKILLIRRGGYPYKGHWALPGGFVNIDEDIRTSAARELFEETGISDMYLEQAFVWSRPDRDPRQRVITVSYIALADFSKICARAGDDAAQAEWFTLSGYNKTEASGTVRIRYLLSGPEALQPIVAYPAGRIQEIACIKSSGLAFDHAESIAYSFECMKQRIKNGGFLPFAFEDEHLQSCARNAILNSAFD